MINDYIAHSANSYGIKQTIENHSMGVGAFMREFALTESLSDLYEFCGMIHDMGKYSYAFQQHVAGMDNNVKHSIYGAIYAKKANMLEVAIPVFGHHSGLPDSSKLRQDIETEENDDSSLYCDVFSAFNSDIGQIITIPSNEPFWNIRDILQQELFVRMLYSSLVDADSLDTERHFYEDKFNTRNSPVFDVEKLLCQLQRRLRLFENDLNSKELKINKLRNEVRLYAETKANSPQGCFSLTLPTGMGKTLCSVNWALHHAKYHRNIKRIIIVLPFINIIDQTADELKTIFKDEDYVLEHHSNIIYADKENSEKINTKQLATENWDYPIIITTSVQFFESLFSNKRASCRKLHNIQDSVIIFDEIQTLPLKVTEPTLTMLDNLQKLCRCSILFCTATQPDFQSRTGFRGISHIESLVECPERIFEETRRVVYHPVNAYNEISISELADNIVKEKKSTLVVFNTKKKAKLFFDEIKGSEIFRLFHLSTNMCPSHRKTVIKNIRRALKDNELIIVSSTQLIEAGVDMDFPVVYRELAPLESIIQSAGRCNREGQLKNENGRLIKGDVYLFALTETGQPSKQYLSWSEFANLLYKGNEDKLYSHDFYSYYYRKLSENFVKTDELRITEDRKNLRFQSVADKYKIIDNNTQPVFVFNYNEDSRNLYNRIKNQEFIAKPDLREVSQYCVQVYDTFINDNRHLIGFEKTGILAWFGNYDTDLGLPLKDEFSFVF